MGIGREVMASLFCFVSLGMSLAQRILDFNAQLHIDATLPRGIRVMNPFRDSGHETVNTLSQRFYEKFYSDDLPRTLILGINPGRHGAGLTGIPFTDTKRLEGACGISAESLQSHETSSVFVYDVIRAFGGAELFYREFFINSICPLGFVIEKGNGSEVNYNYYDNKELQAAVTPFIIDSIRKMIELGMQTDKVFCLGTGKNFKFLFQLNKRERFFNEVVPMEHPRYVMQYKLRQKEAYIDKFIALLKS